MESEEPGDNRVSFTVKLPQGVQTPPTENCFSEVGLAFFRGLLHTDELMRERQAEFLGFVFSHLASTLRLTQLQRREHMRVLEKQAHLEGTARCPQVFRSSYLTGMLYQRLSRRGKSYPLCAHHHHMWLNALVTKES